MSLHVLPTAFLVAGILAGVTSAGVAAAPLQPSEQRATRDPANGAAPVPHLKYRSPFATFSDSGAVEVAPWRTTNDTVGRIGGWRAYAREAAGKVPAEANAPAVTPQQHEQHHGAGSVSKPR